MLSFSSSSSSISLFKSFFSYKIFWQYLYIFSQPFLSFLFYYCVLIISTIDSCSNIYISTLFIVAYLFLLVKAPNIDPLWPSGPATEGENMEEEVLLSLVILPKCSNKFILNYTLTVPILSFPLKNIVKTSFGSCFSIGTFAGRISIPFTILIF